MMTSPGISSKLYTLITVVMNTLLFALAQIVHRLHPQIMFVSFLFHFILFCYSSNGQSYYNANQACQMITVIRISQCYQLTRCSIYVIKNMDYMTYTEILKNVNLNLKYSKLYYECYTSKYVDCSKPSISSESSKSLRYQAFHAG